MENQNTEIEKAVSSVFETNRMFSDSDIDISANRGDEEPHRIHRLHRIIGYVYGLAAHYGNTAMLAKVISIHDHKGDLTVKWSTAPKIGEMELFNRSWCSPMGDGCGRIEHLVKGKTLAFCACDKLEPECIVDHSHSRYKIEGQCTRLWKRSSSPAVA